MARLPYSGGVLKTFQLRELAAVAKDLTSGYVQITTRANFQMRLIQAERRTGSFTANPERWACTRAAQAAQHPQSHPRIPPLEIDPHELIDVQPLR